MAPTTPPFKFNPPLCLFQDSMRDEGAAGAVAVATSAKKKQGKKAPGGLQTLKISNNFGSTGRRNPLQAAKLDGGGSELGMPRKRPAEGTSCQKARGGEVKFPFRLDCKRAYAAQSMKAKPPAIAAKYNNPDDRADQQATNGHGKAGAPKAPAKDGHSVEIACLAEANLDDNESASAGTRKLAWLQALAAAAKLDGGVSGTPCKKATG
jgi:hypothetical protein